MSEEGTQLEPQGTEEPTIEPEEPQGTEEKTDWKAEARKWEARAKENKAKADKLDEIEEANKSDLEKATTRAEKAERELKEIKAAQERVKLADKISKDTGVPANLIQGTTKEEMEQFAKDNAHYFKKDTVPVVGSDGKSASKIPTTTDPIRDLFNNN